MLKHALLGVMLAFCLVFGCPAVTAKTREAVDAAKFVLEKWTGRVIQHELETLAGRIEALAAKHGDNAYDAVRNVGSRAFPLIRQSGDLAPHSISLLAKYGDRAIWLVEHRKGLSVVATHGDMAAEAMLKHGPDVVEPIASFGRPMARALKDVSDQNGRRLVWLSQDGDLAKIGSSEEVLNVIARYDDRAANFIWDHKVVLLAGAALAAFLANPELYLEPTRTEYIAFHDAPGRRVIIFLPGLNGNPRTSFSHGPHYPSWPELMKDDQEGAALQTPLSSFSVGALAYPAGPGDKLSVPQIAQNLLNELEQKGIFQSYDEFYIIAHSLGGLVAKEMLVHSNRLAAKTKTVFLISVPTEGAPVANAVAGFFRFIPYTLIRTLRTINDNAFLQTLQNHWHRLLRDQSSLRPRMRIFCAYETRKTYGVLLVTPQQYTDAHCEDNRRAENEDHVSIVKPKGRDAEIYRWVRAQLISIASKPSRN